MSNRVLVLGRTQKPLMPCSPKRARKLLTAGRAAVYRMQPFTIILKDRADGEMQPIEVKVDPGSKTTGIAVVGDFPQQGRVGTCQPLLSQLFKSGYPEFLVDKMPKM